MFGVKWRQKSLASILALAGPLLVRGADAPSAEGARFFEEKVRPLLEQRCFGCHCINRAR